MWPSFDNLKLCKIALKLSKIMQTVQKINKMCKYCIKSKKIALKCSNNFEKLCKIMRNYVRCIEPRGQNSDKSGLCSRIKWIAVL